MSTNPYFFFDLPGSGFITRINLEKANSKMWLAVMFEPNCLEDPLFKQTAKQGGRRKLVLKYKPRSVAL